MFAINKKASHLFFLIPLSAMVLTSVYLINVQVAKAERPENPRQLKTEKVSPLLKSNKYRAAAVESLYAGTISPISAFRGAIGSDRRELTGLRPAGLDGLTAGDSKAVYWNDFGNFLLKPHDDLAQVRDPIQYDFEIQEAVRVMALNVYAQVPTNSGQLQIWNIEPDDETRAELGLTDVGFPYPAELLDEYPAGVVTTCLSDGHGGMYRAFFD